MPFGKFPSVMFPRFLLAGWLFQPSPSVSSFARTSAYLLAAIRSTVMFRKDGQRSGSNQINFTTILTDAAQQRCTSGAKRAILPAEIPASGIALPALQDPLQRIICDPPTRVELGYDAI